MANPIVQWPGGKRQLIDEIVSKMPKKFNRYYEPFFGGGALYFYLQPKKAVINDCNSQLINVYQQIRDCPDEIIKYMTKLQTKYNMLLNDEKRTKFYYYMRNKFNDCIVNDLHTPKAAAIFVFLNKGCFNSLYRVNSKGLFNSPSNHKKKLNLFDADNITQCSDLLHDAIIKCDDFEIACKTAKKGDFVFFDSPYYGTFDTYQANGFPESDHRRLFKLFEYLTDKGVYCLLTNSETDFIKNLYNDYNWQVVTVKRAINCDPDKRTGTEIIVTNY